MTRTNDTMQARYHWERGTGETVSVTVEGSTVMAWVDGDYKGDHYGPFSSQAEAIAFVQRWRASDEIADLFLDALDVHARKQDCGREDIP